MSRRKSPEVAKPVVPVQEQPVDEPTIDDQPIAGRVLKRPDGYYWEAQGRDPRGPFATRDEAEADLLAGGPTEEGLEAEDGLHEAESELGISDWIDPDTGGPAEDHVPHIDDN
jgi:hypothetical protein